MKTLVLRPGEAQAIPNRHDRVLVSSDAADERFCVLEATIDSTLAPRLHRHRKHVESWFVLDGTLEFSSGNETLSAPAGSFVLAPPHSPHTFRNQGPGGAEILAFHAPGGFDRFLAELARLRTADEPGFRAFGDLLERYETEPVEEDDPAGPPVRLVLPGEGERVSIDGDVITILADSSHTGGLFAVIDYTEPPGSPGGPPHRHREKVDIFYVLDGELTLEIDDETISARPGTLAAVAPGTVHKFSNPSDQPARFLGIVSPGGFEQYFRDVAVAIGDGPFDPAVTAPLIAKYDYEPV